MNYRRYWLALGAALLIGLIAGAAWPPPPLPKLAAENAQWSLPSATDIARHNPQDMASVTANMRWGGTNGPIQQSKSDWRLAGILEDGEPAILVTSATDPSKPERVLINGQLPDGSRLVLVDRDRVKTQYEKCISTYQLFQTLPVEKSPECEEQETTEQGTRK